MSDITVQEIIHLLPTVDADWHERAVAFLVDICKERRQLAEAESELAECRTRLPNHQLGWAIEFASAALRQKLVEANDYAERCTEANRQAELDNDGLRAKLALAEQLLREVLNTIESTPEGIALDSRIVAYLADAAIAAGEGKS